MTFEHILAERRGPVLAITLNRPERLNAAAPAMFEEVGRALGQLNGARAVVIAGAGRAFCSGADLASGALGADDPAEATFRALSDSYHPVLEQLADLPVPVVSAVRGPAAGIGCSLALSADFCVAARDAYFLQAFVNIGLVPDGGSSWMLPCLIGRARALEMTMLGERVSAPKAHDWGMIHAVVAEDQLEAESMRLADRLAAGPTRALGLIRRQLRRAMELDYPAALALEAEHQREARRSPDSAEGGRAFLEKRAPDFTGE